MLGRVSAHRVPDGSRVGRGAAGAPASRRWIPARRAVAAILASAALPGCGTLSRDQLPPPARPAASPPLQAAPAGRVVPADTVRMPTGPRDRVAIDGGRRVAILRRRERVLDIVDARSGRHLARAGAGIGPAQIAAHGGRLYVTDTEGDALLVFVVRPALELVRRVFLAGAPYAIAVDPVREQLWITLTRRNEVVEAPAHALPFPSARWPAVRQPDAIAVDSGTGTALIAGRSAGVVQAIAP